MIPVARVRLSWWGRVKAWFTGRDRARALCSRCYEPMSLYDGDKVARYCIACEIGATHERDADLATRVAPLLLDALARMIRRRDRDVTDHEIHDK